MSASTSDAGEGANTPNSDEGEDARSPVMQKRRKDSWLNLRENEEVVWDGQPHVYPILHWVISPVILCAILVWAVRTYELSGLLLFGCIAVGGIALGTAVWIYLKRASIQYVLTNFGLYERRGVFSEVVTHVHLNRIQNTQYRMSAFGRYIGYGDVWVYTAGTSMRELKCETIPEPGEVDKIISHQLDETEFEAGSNND